jgi:hypothetical protein
VFQAAVLTTVNPMNYENDQPNDAPLTDEEIVALARESVLEGEEKLDQGDGVVDVVGVLEAVPCLKDAKQVMDKMVKFLECNPDYNEKDVDVVNYLRERFLYLKEKSLHQSSLESFSKNLNM